MGVNSGFKGLIRQQEEEEDEEERRKQKLVALYGKHGTPMREHRCIEDHRQ